MIYILILVFLAAYLLFFRWSLACTRKGRRSRLSQYLCRNAWNRQRWSIGMNH